jgi:hypothetical protein
MVGLVAVDTTSVDEPVVDKSPCWLIPSFPLLVIKVVLDTPAAWESDISVPVVLSCFFLTSNTGITIPNTHPITKIIVPIQHTIRRREVQQHLFSSSTSDMLVPLLLFCCTQVLSAFSKKMRHTIISPYCVSLKTFKPLIINSFDEYDKNIPKILMAVIAHHQPVNLNLLEFMVSEFT